jgi:hypothetical protein
MDFRITLMQAANKIADYHLDLIYKREAKIINDSKTWLKIIVEDLKNSERDRYWIVFEEVKTLRANELQSFNMIYDI